MSINLKLDPKEARVVVNALEEYQVNLLIQSSIDDASVIAGVLLRLKPQLLKPESPRIVGMSSEPLNTLRIFDRKDDLLIEECD